MDTYYIQLRTSLNAKNPEDAIEKLKTQLMKTQDLKMHDEKEDIFVDVFKLAGSSAVRGH